MKPKISIIIPMYGVEKYIRRCLDSVKQQTFTSWTAICVDDGSPDKSGEIAEEYAKEDSRFIVVHKTNGGLSDARNYGMKYATGQYIMYLDSDDFIHKQTMEITYRLAEKNKSDIVSFAYDRLYRPMLMIRHILHLSTDNVIPLRFNKKYNVNKIKARTTNDVFDFATEQTHNVKNKNRKWLVKHCQVWKNLYKRTLIEKIPFIKGIVFEDFPWWSEVMLKKPRITSTALPLYYYIPNFYGIVLSAKQLHMIKSLCIGIQHSFKLYKQEASVYQIQQWTENFLWFFIAKAFSKIKFLNSQRDILLVKNLFRNMKKNGIFKVAPEKWYDLMYKINCFIK